MHQGPGTYPVLSPISSASKAYLRIRTPPPHTSSAKPAIYT